MDNLSDLIKEYITATKICYDTDYANKKSVKTNNHAVSRMYKIVEIIALNFGKEGTEEFKKLLDINENKTNIWAATHLLEKLEPEKDLEIKALDIIQEVINKGGVESLGFQYWLMQYKNKGK
ncbi:MAG TPA: hypothetical protein VF581_04240 [Flavobacterium sp.]